MTVVIRYANAYFNLKNQDLWSNAFVETKTGGKCPPPTFDMFVCVVHSSTNR